MTIQNRYTRRSCALVRVLPCLPRCGRLTGCCKVMPDGTLKLKRGKEMQMKEGQMMTMDGKMMEGGKAMEGT